MKFMARLLLLCVFIASALADYATDLKINRTYALFIDKLEGFVEKTSDQAVLQAYESQKEAKISEQSLIELKQLSNNITAPMMAQFRPIAYRIIYDAGYNTKGNYYIMNSTSNVWHLPNQAPPANPINGTAVNSQILGKELQSAFIRVMQSSVLQKRYFGNVIRQIRWGSVSKSSTDLIESMATATHSQKVKKIHNELLNVAKENSRQAQIDRKYLEAQLTEARLQQLEFEQDLQTNTEVLYNSKNWLSLGWNNVFKYEFTKLLGVFLMGNGILAIFFLLFKRDDKSESLENAPAEPEPNTAGLLAPTTSSERVPPQELLSPPKQDLSETDTTTLPKSIRNDGITYYLDERNFQYYYIDPSTNTSKYYSKSK